MNTKILESLQQRRSRYNLINQSTLSEKELEHLLAESLKLTPSAFNSQAGRIVLLLGQKHEQLWDIVMSTLKKIVPPEKFSSTEQKISGFKKSFGTILFFEDMETIEKLQAQFPSYHDTFEVWSNEQAGMLQIVVWSAISENNMGASLQHYNPLIDEEVKAAFSLPTKWKLKAQMPFGISIEEPSLKDKLDMNLRLKVLK